MTRSTISPAGGMSWINAQLSPAMTVEIAVFSRCRVLAPNLFHSGFQFLLATQPSLGVAVAQQAAGVERASKCDVKGGTEGGSAFSYRRGAAAAKSCEL
jgi:hypothetical protein